MRGDTSAAADVWRAIAEGRASPAESMLWVQHIAKRVTEKVIEADLESANRRAEAALKAIGFYGRIDKDRQLREELASFDWENMSRADIVETLRLIGPELEGVPTEKAVKKIDRLRKK